MQITGIIQLAMILCAVFIILDDNAVAEMTDSKVDTVMLVMACTSACAALKGRKEILSCVAAGFALVRLLLTSVPPAIAVVSANSASKIR